MFKFPHVLMRPQQAAKAMTATENKERQDTDQASLEAKTRLCRRDTGCAGIVRKHTQRVAESLDI